MSTPGIVVNIPVEGRAWACVVADTFDEQQRVAVELWHRDVVLDVLLALARLGGSLDERHGSAA